MPTLRTSSRGKYQQVTADDLDSSDGSDGCHLADPVDVVTIDREVDGEDSAAPDASEPQAEPAPGGGADPLRTGWVQFISALDGRTYFVNTATGRSQYHHPNLAGPLSLEPDGDVRMRQNDPHPPSGEALQRLMAVPGQIFRAVRTIASAARKCARQPPAEPGVAAWT